MCRPYYIRIYPLTGKEVSFFYKLQELVICQGSEAWHPITSWWSVQCIQHKLQTNINHASLCHSQLSLSILCTWSFILCTWRLKSWEKDSEVTPRLVPPLAPTQTRANQRYAFCRFLSWSARARIKRHDWERSSLTPTVLISKEKFLVCLYDCNLLLISDEYSLIEYEGQVQISLPFFIGEFQNLIMIYTITFPIAAAIWKAL